MKGKSSTKAKQRTLECQQFSLTGVPPVPPESQQAAAEEFCSGKLMDTAEAEIERANKISFLTCEQKRG
jgi:hypothetical protein